MADLQLGSEIEAGLNNVVRSYSYFSRLSDEAQAAGEVGIFAGQPDPLFSGYTVASVSSRANQDGTGSIVTIRSSLNPPPASAQQPYSQLDNTLTYSISIGFETELADLWRVDTEAAAITAGDTSQLVTKWGEPRVYRQVRKQLTRISLNTSATAAQLGLLGTGSSGDVLKAIDIAQFNDTVITAGSRNLLFRTREIRQGLTPLGSDFASSRFAVTYEFLYDPGVPSVNNGLTAFVAKNAQGDMGADGGQNINDSGFIIPSLDDPYGSSGKYIVPPYCAVIVKQDIPADDVYGQSGIINRAPKFLAQKLYDTSTVTIGNLPGVPL